MGLLSAALVSIVVALVWRFPGSMGVISPEATLVIGTVGLDFVVAVAPDRQLPTMHGDGGAGRFGSRRPAPVLARARLGYLIHYLPFPVVAGLIGGLGILLVIGGLTWPCPICSPAVTASRPCPRANCSLPRPSGRCVGWSSTAGLPHQPAAAGHRCHARLLAGTGCGRAFGLAAAGFRCHDNYRAGRCLAQPDRRGLGGDRQRFPHAGDARGFPGCRRPRRRRHDGGGPGCHLEPNGTLRAFGIANLASGSIGGFPSVMNLSGTSLAHRCRSSCRMVGVVAGTVPLTIYWLGPHSLGIVPAFVVGRHRGLCRARVRGRVAGPALASPWHPRPRHSGRRGRQRQSRAFSR